MTEECLERNRKNSERLNEIIVWSFLNQSHWSRLCAGDLDQGIKTHHLNAIIDQCLHFGFMEIYYLLLTKLADVVGIGTDLEQVTQFLELCVDKNITLNLGEISKAIQQAQSDAQ